MLSICFLKDKLEKLNAQKVGTRSTRTVAVYENTRLQSCSMMNNTESLDELQYLFALQRSNIQSLGVDPLSAAGDLKYLASRPILLKAIVAVATYHEMSDDVVYLAASVLDAFVAKRNSIPMASANLLHQPIQVFAIASLSTAANFIDGSGAYYQHNSFLNIKTRRTCTLQHIKLSHYVESWQNACRQLQHNSAASLDSLAKQFLCQAFDIQPLDVQQAQMQLAATIDWRFNRATANRFLEVYTTRHLILGHEQGRDVRWVEESMPWTRYFCESSIMNDIGIKYNGSRIASASFICSRKFLYGECDLQNNMDSACLQNLYCITSITDERELEDCVNAILELHNVRCNNPRSPVPNLTVELPEDVDELHLDCDLTKDLLCTEEMLVLETIVTTKRSPTVCLTPARPNAASSAELPAEAVSSTQTRAQGADNIEWDSPTSPTVHLPECWQAYFSPSAPLSLWMSP